MVRHICTAGVHGGDTAAGGLNGEGERRLHGTRRETLSAKALGYHLAVPLFACVRIDFPDREVVVRLHQLPTAMFLLAIGRAIRE